MACLPRDCRIPTHRSALGSEHPILSAPSCRALGDANKHVRHEEETISIVAFPRVERVDERNVVASEDLFNASEIFIPTCALKDEMAY
jgi:hypothetical protein